MLDITIIELSQQVKRVEESEVGLVCPGGWDQIRGKLPYACRRVVACLTGG